MLARTQYENHRLNAFEAKSSKGIDPYLPKSKEIDMELHKWIIAASWKIIIFIVIY